MLHVLLKVDQKENYVNVGCRLKQISLITKYATFQNQLMHLKSRIWSLLHNALKKLTKSAISSRLSRWKIAPNN